MNITVAGLGLIGGSMALDLREKKFATHVTGYDENEDHAAKALKQGIVDEVAPFSTAFKKADFVILAVPVDSICEILPDVLNLIPESATVTDVGSAKEIIVRSVAKHPRRKLFVPSHPMAGTENSGPQAAIKGLFKNKTAVICDEMKSDPHHLNRVREMYEVLGMRCISMSSKDHDRHTAFVSHLSHISSFILANTVLDVEKDVSTIFDLAGGGFESTVRLAKSSPDMWVPIFEHNAEYVAEAMEAHIKHLQVFHKALKEKKWMEIRILLARANEIRRVLQNMTERAKKK